MQKLLESFVFKSLFSRSYASKWVLSRLFHRHHVSMALSWEGVIHNLRASCKMLMEDTHIHMNMIQHVEHVKIQ